MTRKVNEFSIQRNPHSVTITYRQRQSICFHAYGEPNKRKLQAFADDMMTRKRLDINTVYSRAKRYDVQSMATNRIIM